MNKDEDEIVKLRGKLLDIEEELHRLKNINDLFVPFAVENSPEGAIVSELISERLEALQNIIRF